MEAQTALVGAQGRVELDAVPTVDSEGAGIVFPNDTKLNDAFRNRNDLESSAILGVLLEQGAILQGADELWWPS